MKRGFLMVAALYSGSALECSRFYRMYGRVRTVSALHNEPQETARATERTRVHAFNISITRSITHVVQLELRLDRD